MATHSSTLAWRIPWREEPGRLQSMGSQRVGHDWATSLYVLFNYSPKEQNWSLSEEWGWRLQSPGPWKDGRGGRGYPRAPSHPSVPSALSSHWVQPGRVLQGWRLERHCSWAKLLPRGEAGNGTWFLSPISTLPCSLSARWSFQALPLFVSLSDPGEARPHLSVMVPRSVALFVMNTVCVNVTARCDIIKSGCDVICIHMMSCILCLCYQTHNGGYMIDNLGVNTERQWMCCQIYSVWYEI